MERKRRECRVCGSTELVPVIILPNYPMVAGPVMQVPKTVPTCDLEVWLCHRCGTCVLLNTDVDKLAYDDDYTSSNITYGHVKSMDEQTDRFVEFVGRAGKSPSSKVLEIGCYNGVLMGLLGKRYRFKMLGCEPCVSLAEEAGGKGYDVRSSVFNATDYDKLDMVVARNILEHIPSPSQFVKGVASTLKQDGAFVLEVPAGEHCIRNGILGTIVPEHPCYFGRDSLERLLGDHFTTITLEESGATIRAVAFYPYRSKSGEGGDIDATQLRTGVQIRQTRYDAIQKAVDGEKVDIFGANTCTLELIAAGAVKTEQIGEIYDDDPRRWGRYLVNTNLIVSPRSAISKGKRQKVLVCSYTHRQSIAEYVTKQNRTAVKLYGDEE